MGVFDNQKRIALLIGAFGLSATAINFIVGIALRGESPMESLLTRSVLIPLIASVMFFATWKLNHVSIRYFHIISIIVIGSMSVMDTYDSFYGMGLMVLAAVLAYKYGFFSIRIRLKIILSSIFLLFLIEASVLYSDPGKIGVGLDVIAFMLFYLTFLYLLYKDDINRLASKNHRLEQSLSALITERSRLEVELTRRGRQLKEFEKNIEHRLAESEQKIMRFKDMKKLTNKELEIVILVYETGNSNKQIAEDLGVAVGTVKQHLSRIYNKIDVVGRSQMITALREYLTEPEPQL